MSHDRTRRLQLLAALCACCAWLLCGLAGSATLTAQDRTRAPMLGPPPKLDLPAIQKRTLSNGLPVWILENHEVPLVQVNLLVLAGSGDDPSGKSGVASLTAAMLDEGAGNRSSLEIADEIEFLGATLTTSSSFDASAVRLNVPVARLAAALPVLADVALRPTFPDADLERLRQERLTSLLQARDDPDSVAPLAFQRIVFGPGHRYGTGSVGTSATLKMLSAPDLRTFHTSFYQPSNARIVVVGDVKPDETLAQLEKNFGGWKNTSAVRRTMVPTAPQLQTRQIYIVDMPEAPQSQIRIGWVGVPRATPDFFAIEVLNTILGGSFSSRLNQNLREEHQYTYGASSRFDMRLSAGAFVAGAGVQTDKTADALREFFNELSSIGKPIPAEELTRAKNYLALSFPAEFETSRDLSVRVEEMMIYNLPDEYFDRYVANVEAITAPMVQKAAATYIQPSRFAVVIVGDRKAIEPTVRALNLGPVRVMSVEEASGL